ncbi:hypothetical protein L6452_04950 [Arctium lappa]|uniref:Uncharacterized protein n=1 Tax=Arctium lappa TaxID=4217 RepID=A0ACB9EFM1_ARCLA|nr:hypothetical protein L6452_04950 [Arctium lappa]
MYDNIMRFNQDLILRKISHHQEKMKKTTPNAHGTTKQSILENDDRTSTPIGCFPSFFKKIHPSATSSTVPVSDSSPRPYQQPQT